MCYLKSIAESELSQLIIRDIDEKEQSRVVIFVFFFFPSRWWLTIFNSECLQVGAHSKQDPKDGSLPLIGLRVALTYDQLLGYGIGQSIILFWEARHEVVDVLVRGMALN